jgi:hypothetical protein
MAAMEPLSARLAGIDLPDSEGNRVMLEIGKGLQTTNSSARTNWLSLIKSSPKVYSYFVFPNIWA